jgi:XTP/dITP diphosphohydrolase
MLPAPGRIVVATANVGKLREIRAILVRHSFELVSLDGCELSVVFPEESDAYEPNALAKAHAVASQLGEWALADDSGLEVDALDGAPGPLSARFGGPGLDDCGRVAHLLGALEGVPAARRGARFVCWTALVGPDGEARTGFGECRGRILPRTRGEGGFGYDPVFAPEGESCSMAELPAARKNRISHRARSLAVLWADLGGEPGG